MTSNAVTADKSLQDSSSVDISKKDNKHRNFAKFITDLINKFKDNEEEKIEKENEDNLKVNVKFFLILYI